MRLAEHLTALRAWCKQCLSGLWKPDMLPPVIVGMRGHTQYDHTTTAMHEYRVHPPPPHPTPPHSHTPLFFGIIVYCNSTAGRHHKAADTLADRNVITRLFYGCYPFFAFCCVGTELFYVALYLMVFIPEASLSLGIGGAGTVSLYAVSIVDAVGVAVVGLCYGWGYSFFFVRFRNHDETMTSSITCKTPNPILTYAVGEAR